MRDPKEGTTDRPEEGTANPREDAWSPSEKPYVPRHLKIAMLAEIRRAQAKYQVGQDDKPRGEE